MLDDTLKQRAWNIFRPAKTIYCNLKVYGVSLNLTSKIVINLTGRGASCKVGLN